VALTVPVLPPEWRGLQLELEGGHVWRLLAQVERVVHGVGVGVRVGGMRRVLVVVGRVSQRRMEVPLPSPRRRGPFRPLGRPSLAGQTGLVGGRPVGLRDDDAGVVEEGSGAEAVVVYRLGVGLQVALHVLWVEGEVGA